MDARLVGTPGSMPVGLFLSAGTVDPLFPTIWGKFHLRQSFMLIDLKGAISSSGVKVLPASLPALPLAPYEIFLQAMIGNHLSNLSALEVR